MVLLNRSKVSNRRKGLTFKQPIAAEAAGKPFDNFTFVKKLDHFKNKIFKCFYITKLAFWV